MPIIEMKVPTIGESITEVTLSAWLKNDGEYVKIDEPICEFESDKATLEFPAETSGKLIYVAAEGDDLEIGALVAKIDTSAEAPVPAPAGNKESSIDEAPTIPDASESAKTVQHSSPAAGKILRENDLQAASIKGSGRDGRITKADASEAAKNKAKLETAPVVKLQETVVQTPSSNTQFSRSTRREKMSRMRRTIASRLVSAKNDTAMLTTFNEVDLSEIIKLRKKYQEKFVEKYGIKLGYMSLFATACAQVLMEMPQVNARIEDNDLIYHDYADISIAISTDKGLVVPPIHNVESLHFSEIEKKIKILAGKARNGTLSLAEMQGGTFTITNGGIFGSMLSTPILNQPQSAILGMHNIIQRPVAVDGNIEIRPMMYLALSYDHRVIDGSSSVTFLVKVIQKLQDPIRLIMEI